MTPSILKPLIRPIQMRILEKRRCPACTRELDSQKSREPLTTETELVRCECDRYYIYNRNQRKYRRALPEEVR